MTLVAPVASTSPSRDGEIEAAEATGAGVSKADGSGTPFRPGTGRLSPYR
jgi:hypothetical protein